MKEYDLQMAWKLAVLAGKSLQTTDGDAIEIIFPGYGPSVLGGPDFTFAKIKINDTVWMGSLEVHTQSSLWYAHKHDKDDKYNNVILHVVWEKDIEVKGASGEVIPCLQLKDYMSASWFAHIDQKIFSSPDIPCGNLIHLVPEVVWQSQLDTTLIERVERRVADVQFLYHQCHCDWDETLYRFTTRFMGKKINNQCMEQLAISIPYKIILKQSASLLDIEALLFGQAGFLEEQSLDAYTEELKQRFIFLSHKYQLKKIYNLRMQWQYKGLRPAGFPERHIAQWAYLLHTKGRLMNWAVDTAIEELKVELHGTSEYWKTHYRLGKKSRVSYFKNYQWSNLLLINALIPFRIAYRKNTDPSETSVLIDAYDVLAAEKNNVVTLFERYNHRAFSARDTQAMLELYNNYCNYKKCLSCKIGHVILKQEGLL